MNEDTAMVPVNLFGVTSALDVIEAATGVATPLAQLIRDRQLASTISGREYVRVEGWTLLGSMLGVFPIVEWTRPVESGWEARVEARTRAGEIVGAAESQCLRSERNWEKRDDFALRSMAQTRATSKALRLPLGFVMALAGFEATPAEEMVEDDRPSGPPCPHCGTPVLFNEEKTRGRKPVWSCPNFGCGGGSPKKEGGNWPWGSYNPNEFREEGDDPVGEMVADAVAATIAVGNLRQAGLIGEPAPVSDEAKTAMSDLTPTLYTLRIGENQARSELEAYALNPRFAAGGIKQMREQVDRALTLTVALGLAPDQFGELWKEWQGEDPARAGLVWATVKGADVQSFARFVQGYLRGLLGI